MNASEPEPKPAMDASTKLAYERTYLGHERTQMGWVRTSLALISFGFTIVKFFEFLHEMEGKQARVASAQALGVIMIAMGLVLLILASIHHRHSVNLLRQHCPDLPAVSLAEIAGIFIAVIGILALIGSFVRHFGVHYR